MKRTAVCLALIAVFTTSARAQASTAEFRFPTLPIGPRAAALGGAGVAWYGDAEAATNPAVLLESSRFSIHRYEGFADYGGTLVAGNVPLGKRIALGMSLRRFGWDRLIEDDLGAGAEGLDASETRFNVTVAVAPTKLARVGLAVSRLVADNLGSRTTATTYSVGAVVEISRHTRAGLAVLNAGAPARNPVGGTSYPLATRLRVGMVQAVSTGVGMVTVMGDLESAVRRQSLTTASAGVEWQGSQSVRLRVGYENSENPEVPGTRIARWAAGLGLVIGRIETGFATRFGGPTIGYESFYGVDLLRPAP